MKKYFHYLLVGFTIICGYILAFVVLSEQFVFLKHKVMMITFVIISWLILLFGIKKKVAKKWIMICSIVVLIINVMLTGYIKGLSRLIHMTGQEKIKNVIIVAKKNSDVTLEQLKGKKMGVKFSEDNVGLFYRANETALAHLQEKPTYESLIESLMENEYESVMLLEEDQEFIRNQFPKYDFETKIVKAIAIEDIYKDLRTTNINTNPYTVYLNAIKYQKIGKNQKQAIDSIHLVATINPKARKIVIADVPKNTLVTQFCDANEKRVQLSATNYFGPYCAMKSISHLFAMNINYYLFVDYETIADLLLMLQDDSYRHEFNRSEEISNQLKSPTYRASAIKTLLSNIKLSTILLNFNKISYYVSHSIKTNFTAEELRDLIGKELSDASLWQIETQLLEGTTENTLHNDEGLEIFQHSLSTAVENMRENLK